MSDQMPPGGGPKRMSRNVKLVLMGVGAMALLYSCTPAVGAFRALPFLWGFGNPFYRPPMATTCPPGSLPNCEQDSRSGGGSSSGSSFRSGSSSTTSSSGTAGQSSSERGGFGSSATAHGSGGSGS